MTSNRLIRLYFIFVAGIIMPAVFLSYLGFRSFQYEGMLLKKQSEERYKAAVEVMEQRVQEKLISVVASLQKIVTQEPFQQWDIFKISLDALSIKNLDGKHVEEIFVFDDKNKMVFPILDDAQAYYEKPDKTLDWGFYADEIKRLEQLEFIEKDISGAIKGYETLRPKPLSPILQATLLKNIASSYLKINKPKTAETYYLKLLEEFDYVPDPVGYPTGIVGRQLLSKLYDSDGRATEATATRLELLEGLILHKWQVSKGQRDLLVSSLDDSLSAYFSEPASNDLKIKWNRINLARTQLKKLRPQGEYFKNCVWPDIKNRLRKQKQFEQYGGVFAFTEESQGYSKKMAVLAPINDQKNDIRKGTVLAVIEAGNLWIEISGMVSDLEKTTGLKVKWAHSADVKNTQSSGSWKRMMEIPVTAINPPMVFEIFEPVSNEQSQIWQRRNWILGGVIGLSLLVILIGLIAMGQALKREAEIANMKTNFAANVSHELRTPLSTISYIAERLKLKRYRSEEELNDFYVMLGEESVRLKDLVENTLDFSKMLEGKRVYHMEKINFSSLIKDVCEHFKNKATQNGFTLTHGFNDKNIFIFGDKRLLAQAILNLLDNALKYSGDSRRIELKLLKHKNYAVLTVQDFGIGIPKYQQQKIFDKFYRVEPALTRESVGGVGLGLSIVKEIMDIHKGQIKLESDPGKGSAFSLWFPLVNETGTTEKLKY